MIRLCDRADSEPRAALLSASYFAERKGRVDWAAFDRLMARSGGEPPRTDDEPLPPDRP